MTHRLTRRRRREIATLVRKKHRDERGEMLVEGVRSVEAAVEAEAPLVEVLVAETVQDEPRVEAILRRVTVPVHVLPEREVARLADTETSQGILAVARTEVISDEQLEGASSVLALDSVQDPGNVGTLMRTAAWFGIQVVVGGIGTAGFFHPKVVRAAAGSLWDVGLSRSRDLPETLRRLRAAGFSCYGADLAGTPAPAWRPDVPSVLVLGSEAHGLSDAVRACLDDRVAIPGAARRRGTESLNVAVAAGILLYEWSAHST